MIQAADDRDPIRTKESAGTFGRHTLLNADVVELEFKMDPAKVGETVDLKGADSRTISQQMGVASGLKLGSASNLTHQYLFGMNQSSQQTDPLFGEQETQRFQQRQITTFNTRPTEKMKVSLSNELVQESVDNQQRGSRTLKQGAGVDYALPLGIALRPEVSHESFLNESLQETERNHTSMAIKKDLVPKLLDLQVKPGVAMENQLYSGGQTSEAGKLDLSLNWKPDALTQWTWGAKAQETSRIEEMSQEQLRSLYSQLNYKLWADCELRMRGDLQNTRKALDGYGLSSDQSVMNLNFGPSMKLSETVSAGAELGYRHQVDHLSREQSNEKSFSLSIKGSF